MSSDWSEADREWEKESVSSDEDAGFSSRLFPHFNFFCTGAQLIISAVWRQSLPRPHAASDES